MYAEEARRITSATEAQYLSAFSELIANFSSSDHNRRTCTVVTEAFLADYTDSFVTAYRAFPQLLQAAASDPKTVDLISPSL